MRIEVYYEDKNNPTILDVPDDQCEIWVEDDYQRRLAEAEDNSTVEKRTVQQIMNEDFNNPTFNNNQTETRRHVSFDALEELGIDSFDAAKKQVDDFAKALADGGVVPKFKWNTVTMEEAKNIFAAIRANMPAGDVA